MSIIYPIFLSSTQPNDNVPTMIIRQFDEGTQVLDVTVTEHGKSKDISKLTPFFCVKQGHHIGLGISEQKVTKIVDASKGKFQYTFTNYDLQSVGENTAYFSFKELQNDLSWKQQFSTRDFVYQVKESIYDDGIKDSNYIWTFEEILRYFQEWIKNSQEIYEDWYTVAQNELKTIISGFQEWIKNSQEIYEDWYTVAQNELKTIISGFQEWILSSQENYDQWNSQQQIKFDQWFDSIKGVLDGDTAGNLLGLIEQMKQAHFTLKCGDIGMLRTIRDDNFSLNHTVKTIETIDHTAEIDSIKQNTFFLRKVGTI